MGAIKKIKRTRTRDFKDLLRRKGSNYVRLSLADIMSKNTSLVRSMCNYIFDPLAKGEEDRFPLAFLTDVEDKEVEFEWTILKH